MVPDVDGTKYLYSERELQSLAKGFGNLEERGVTRAYAIFNNCYQNFGIMNATTMAAILQGFLSEGVDRHLK